LSWPVGADNTFASFFNEKLAEGEAGLVVAGVFLTLSRSDCPG